MKIICNTPGKGREVRYVKREVINSFLQLPWHNKYKVIKHIMADDIITADKTEHENVKEFFELYIKDYGRDIQVLLNTMEGCGFIELSPELPAYYSDNTTPLPIGEWDVELQDQYDLNEGDGWLNCDKTWHEAMVRHNEKYPGAVKTRQIYISPLPPAQPVKAVEEEKPKHTCWHVPETSPCEGCQYEQDNHPIETPAIATSEGVESPEYWRGVSAGANYILTTHVPVDEVEKINSVLKQIRRVELLTPETEALINKILNP